MRTHVCFVLGRDQEALDTRLTFPHLLPRMRLLLLLLLLRVSITVVRGWRLRVRRQRRRRPTRQRWLTIHSKARVICGKVAERCATSPWVLWFCSRQWWGNSRSRSPLTVRAHGSTRPVALLMLTFVLRVTILVVPKKRTVLFPMTRLAAVVADVRRRRRPVRFEGVVIEAVVAAVV